MGLKGPPNHFFYGNMNYFIERTKKMGWDDGYKVLGEWAEEYGETYG